MAVVINEFEVVPGEAPPTQSNASANGQSEAAPPDIEQMLEHERERCERIWAH